MTTEVKGAVPGSLIRLIFDEQAKFNLRLSISLLFVGVRFSGLTVLIFYVIVVSKYKSELRKLQFVEALANALEIKRG